MILIFAGFSNWFGIVDKKIVSPFFSSFQACFFLRSYFSPLYSVSGFLLTLSGGANSSSLLGAFVLRSSRSEIWGHFFPLAQNLFVRLFRIFDILVWWECSLSFAFFRRFQWGQPFGAPGFGVIFWTALTNHISRRWNPSEPITPFLLEEEKSVITHCGI